jgi:glycosyltransferase involved in cell wall biosynthesis
MHREIRVSEATLRLAVLFHRLGPYHHARLNAAGKQVAVTGIELSAVDDTYAWAAVPGAERFRRVTLFQQRDVVHEPAAAIWHRVHEALEQAQPEAVAIPGWADRGALAALHWCVRRGVPMILMSESTQQDERRRWWKEAVKWRIVRLFQAGLVGGRLHREYLTELGLKKECIAQGYDVVDNEHFRHGAAAARANEGARRQQLALPERYFLASNRFIPKKNLPGLLQAFAAYRKAAGAGAWDLVVLGDGELRPELEALREQLGLGDCIHLPGFRQYEELPAYYGLAGAFVHASTTEQWGLVVNEAMAAGLPVLVSQRCGCAPDLVEEGRNGFTFDPQDTDGLSRHLLRMSGGEYDRLAMGRASEEMIAHWTPDTFAEGLLRATRAGMAAPRPRFGPVERLILKALIGR